MDFILLADIAQNFELPENYLKSLNPRGLNLVAILYAVVLQTIRLTVSQSGFANS